MILAKICRVLQTRQVYTRQIAKIMDEPKKYSKSPALCHPECNEGSLMGRSGWCLFMFFFMLTKMHDYFYTPT